MHFDLGRGQGGLAGAGAAEVGTWLSSSSFLRHQKPHKQGKNRPCKSLGNYLDSTIGGDYTTNPEREKVALVPLSYFF